MATGQATMETGPGLRNERAGLAQNARPARSLPPLARGLAWPTRSEYSAGRRAAWAGSARSGNVARVTEVG